MNDRDLGVEGLEDASWVGSGASAMVYRARQAKLNREVAVKVLTERDESFVRRFEREAKILGQLSQKPGIVTVYDAGVTSSGQPYLILELCPSSLEDRIRSDGTVAPIEAAGLLAEVADAVADAHAAGVVHRDIKPGNILLSSAGRPLVTDFGIGAMIDSTAGRSTSIGFTPGYVAPETLNGTRATEPADVYAIGATLHHLLTGRAPFVDTLEDPSNLLALVSKVVHDPVPDLRGRGVPDAVCLVMESAMAKDPSRRPTASQLSEALLLVSDPLADTEALSRILPQWDVASPGSARRPPPPPTTPPTTPAATTATALPTERSGPPARQVLPSPGPGRPASDDSTMAGPPSGQGDPPPPPPPPTRLPPPPPTSAAAGHRPEHNRRSSATALLFLVFAGVGAVLVVGLLGLAVFVRTAEEGPITEAVLNEPEIETTPIVSDVDVVDRADDAESGFVQGDGRPVRATSEIEAAPTCAGRSDGRLRIGGLLPLSGGISALGPAMEAGAELAVDDINALGGVLGTSVEWVVGDSTNNSADASLAVDELLAADVDVIIGAATSTLSRNVADAIAAQCVVQISPSNTSSFFTISDPAQLYFRTAPSDVLQGQALAEVISADGPSSVFLIGLNVAYGQELVESTSTALESRGVTVLGSSFYTADQTDYGVQIGAAVAADPEALVLVGFGETSRLLTELIGAGLGPAPVPVYLVDGNLRDYDDEIPVPGALLGVQGTRPGAEVDAEFRERLLALNPDMEAFTYGPETYDAVMIAALAAAVANSDSASELAQRINGVTVGGQPCFSYEDCLFQIQRDVDIDYDGPSGRLSFSQAGEPTEATYRLMTYEADNRLAETVVRYVDVTVSD